MAKRRLRRRQGTPYRVYSNQLIRRRNMLIELLTGRNPPCPICRGPTIVTRKSAALCLQCLNTEAANAKANAKSRRYRSAKNGSSPPRSGREDQHNHQTDKRKVEPRKHSRVPDPRTRTHAGQRMEKRR